VPKTAGATGIFQGVPNRFHSPDQFITAIPNRLRSPDHQSIAEKASRTTRNNMLIQRKIRV